MKSRINQIAERVISASTGALVVVFAIFFTVLAVCAGISAIADFDILSLIACVASAWIAQFWYDFLKD